MLEEQTAANIVPPERYAKRRLTRNPKDATAATIAKGGPGMYLKGIIHRATTVRHSRIPYQSTERFFCPDSSPSEAEAACRDADAIAKACGFSAMANEGEKAGQLKTGSALYVIAAENEAATKIGISYSPIERLADLQSAHWAELRLHAVVWSVLKGAGKIEYHALQMATERGVRLMGEWVSLSPSEAFALIWEAAKELGQPLCDSATWMDNWNDRVRSVGAARSYLARAA